MNSDSFPHPPAQPPDLDHQWQHRILLGIDHQQNRHLLAKLLGRFYSLQDSPSEGVKLGECV